MSVSKQTWAWLHVLLSIHVCVYCKYAFVNIYACVQEFHVLSSLEVAAVAECTEYKDPTLPPPVNQPSIKHSQGEVCAGVFISSSVNQLDWWPTHLSTHPYIVHACEHSLCMPTKWVDGAFYMGCKHWESIVPFMHETHKITWFSFPGKIMDNYWRLLWLIVQFLTHSYAAFVFQYFSIIFLDCINMWNPHFYLMLVWLVVDWAIIPNFYPSELATYSCKLNQIFPSWVGGV